MDKEQHRKFVEEHRAEIEAAAEAAEKSDHALVLTRLDSGQEPFDIYRRPDGHWYKTNGEKYR